jgi:hypothetical protein
MCPPTSLNPAPPKLPRGSKRDIKAMAAGRLAALF